MNKDNLFDGEGARPYFAKHVYKRLMCGKWFSYADVMADYMQLESKEFLPNCVSNCNDYGELRKAFRDVYHAIINEVGEGCIEEQGNNRNKSFRDIGNNDNPLATLINARVVIKDLKKYWEFCQDSAGFFPEVRGWNIILRIVRICYLSRQRRRKGEQVISSDVDRHQTNIDYLPILYESIKNHQVLSIDYKPYEKEVTTLTFHPHYLKGI